MENYRKMLPKEWRSGLIPEKFRRPLQTDKSEKVMKPIVKMTERDFYHLPNKLYLEDNDLCKPEESEESPHRCNSKRKFDKGYSVDRRYSLSRGFGYAMEQEPKHQTINTRRIKMLKSTTENLHTDIDSIGSVGTVRNNTLLNTHGFNLNINSLCIHDCSAKTAENLHTNSIEKISTISPRGTSRGQNSKPHTRQDFLVEPLDQPVKGISILHKNDENLYVYKNLGSNLRFFKEGGQIQAPE
jgi:hypothetical protein